MTNWNAPYRGGLTSIGEPINSKITIPGSKSATNRALILAAIAKTPSRLRKPLSSRDADLMVKGLQSLGCNIEELKTEQGFDYQITPQKLSGPTQIDVGNAGTVMRFLPPIASLATGLVHFDGDARSHERPLGPVIKALEQLGASIEHGNKFRLPLTINGSGEIKGGEVEVDASASSQFISALMLLGPATKNGLTIKNIGETLPSMPHIEMTIQMLRQYGATVEIGENSWTVAYGDLLGQDLTIEPDLSNAAPFLSIAMICGGDVTIADWPKQTTQPGDQLRDILTQMGAKVEFVSNGLKLTGTGKIHGIDIDLHDVGELTPAIAALCALADSPSHLRGIGHLRLHETDRLAALTNEINALGGNVTEEETALHITPAPLHTGIFHTYDDHRLATAGAAIGLVVPGIEVENIATTRKTLPDFPGLWSSLTA
jgi:3-phosphoshikimate 1-carboxyvinyltransferase